jgi:antirestriction protein ArdC
MTAAYLCGQAGITPRVIENQAAYISGWLGQLKKDRKLIIHAAAQGQRAADWILGNRYTETEKHVSEPSEAEPQPEPVG